MKALCAPPFPHRSGPVCEVQGLHALHSWETAEDRPGAPGSPGACISVWGRRPGDEQRAGRLQGGRKRGSCSLQREGARKPGEVCCRRRAAQPAPGPGSGDVGWGLRRWFCLLPSSVCLFYLSILSTYYLSPIYLLTCSIYLTIYYPSSTYLPIPSCIYHGSSVYLPTLSSDYLSFLSAYLWHYYLSTCLVYHLAIFIIYFPIYLLFLQCKVLNPWLPACLLNTHS